MNEQNALRDLGWVLGRIEATDPSASGEPVDGDDPEVQERYTQRHRLVMMAAGLAAQLNYPTGFSFDPKWPAFPLLFIELPGVGQVSWHLKSHAFEWDEHTNGEKYARISTFSHGVQNALSVMRTAYGNSPHLAYACPDCNSWPGHPHRDICAVACCLLTGFQRLSCQHLHECGQDVWEGITPGLLHAAIQDPLNAPAAIPTVRAWPWDPQRRTWVQQAAQIVPAVAVGGE